MNNEDCATISVIIPTLNETETILDTIRHVREAEDVEIIVVDGGSTDTTISIARETADHILYAMASRGGQMDVGAEKARGDILLFLHADTYLPKGWDSMVRNGVKTDSIGGAFNLSINSDNKYLSFVSCIANLRSRFLGMTYGDQAIFVKRDVFNRVGGFKGLPLFEDVDLWRRLKRCGRLVIMKDSVHTSSRRWKQKGAFIGTVKNMFFILLYYIGVSPQRLYKQYYGK
ncbi:MAG: TIGR04283 family arsenosugar biosynthesis glycosyltransferase [Thermodesulfobacteriota bacterium]